MPFLILLLCWALPIIGLGYGVEQSSFYRIVTLYSISFLAYYWIIKDDIRNVEKWLVFSVVIRFILLFAFPALSDDIYRFFWDGILSVHGSNPYLYLPSEVGYTRIPGLDAELFQQLNSPDYYTVYPPISQIAYFLGAYISPQSIYGASIVMKIPLFLAEIGSFYFIYRLLQHYKLPVHHVLIYAFNPLVIIETMGNLHFEALMFFFLIASLYFLIVKPSRFYLVIAAALFACSVATKLHTLMLLPFILIFLNRKSLITFLALSVLSMAVLLSPLLIGIGYKAFGASLDLYFQKFEFNASIYYAFRWIGYQIKGYNLISVIGPALSITSLLGMLGLWFYGLKEKISFKTPKAYSLCLGVFTLFLLFTTTVHPWYLIIPIGLSVFTRFRFVLFWSFLITLSYMNYAYPIYSENLWIVGLEYGVVIGWLAYELKGKGASLVPKSI